MQTLEQFFEPLYVAVTIHLEHNSVPLCMLLDIVEVARSHSGVNLAEEFVNILDDFCIAIRLTIVNSTSINYLLKTSKILSITCNNALANDTMIEHLSNIIMEFFGAAN
jgi:hypothetical protein